MGQTTSSSGLFYRNVAKIPVVKSVHFVSWPVLKRGVTICEDSVTGRSQISNTSQVVFNLSSTKIY